jgi:hypothetical protein
MNHEQRRGPLTLSPEPGEVSGDELTYRLHQQERLARFGVLALETPDFTLLLLEATRLCAEGLHVRYCKVMEYLPDEDRFIVRAGVGWRPGVIGSRTGADLESLTGYAFRNAEAVISTHLDGECRFRTPRALVEHGIRRVINVPITTRNRRYGVLEIRIQWTLDRTQEPPRLHLSWEESGGPPVQVPKRRGFGTRLIERSLALDLEGDVRIEFAPSGVTCTVDAPSRSTALRSPHERTPGKAALSRHLLVVGRQARHLFLRST